MYVPPFTITEKMLHLVSEISEQVGILNARLGEDIPSPMLRKKNQIKTIHSSLAIENNTLSLKQVTDIVDGKCVLGAPDEIQEVKNAVEAYHLMPQLDAFKEKDLLFNICFSINSNSLSIFTKSYITITRRSWIKWITK